MSKRLFPLSLRLRETPMQQRNRLWSDMFSLNQGFDTGISTLYCTDSCYKDTHSSHSELLHWPMHEAQPANYNSILCM